MARGSKKTPKKVLKAATATARDKTTARDKGKEPTSTDIRTRPSTPSTGPPRPPHVVPRSTKAGIESGAARNTSPIVVGSLTTLSTTPLVDPVLEKQLMRHKWVEQDGDAFFDRFFKEAPRAGSPLDKLDKLPNLSKEKTVIEWIVHSRSRPARRSWQSVTAKPLAYMHPPCHTLPNLKPDLVTYRQKDMQKKPDLLQWDDVVSIVELKFYKHNPPNTLDKFLLQLSEYARAVFGAQPGRMYIHAFLIAQTTMRCWLYTRAGMNGSRTLDLTNTDDLKICARVLHGHVTLSDEEMGMTTLSSGSIVNFGTETFILGPLLSWSNRSNIVSRSTTIWYAKEVAEGVSQTTEVLGSECDFVVKLSHQYHTLATESELYQTCKELKVKGIAMCHGFKNLRSVHDVLGPCKDKGTTLPRRVAAEPAAQPAVQSATQARRSLRISRLPQKLPPPERKRPEKKQLTNVPSKAPPQRSTVPDRVPVLLVLDRGTPIGKFASYVDLFASFRDAIRAHYSLLTTGRILHRDISCNNIMITRGSRDDDFCGFLIDLDHAIDIDQHLASNFPERTGTREFMSIRLLDPTGPKLHSYIDDLQSFLWVFIWICTRQDARSRLRWHDSDETAFDKKLLIQGNDVMFKRMIRGLGHMAEEKLPNETSYEDTDDAESVKSIIRLIRKLLPVFPTDDEVDTGREEFYRKMVEAFDSRLPPTKKIGLNWMEI